MRADSACAGNTESLQRFRATVLPDHLLHLLILYIIVGRAPSLKTQTYRPRLTGGSVQGASNRPRQAVTVRPSKGKHVASQGVDGEIRGIS